MLADGRYDAVIVDGVDVEGDDPHVRVELAVSSGPHRGEVVAVRGRFAGRDAVDLLGLPVTLRVDGGVPSVTVDW